MFNQDPYCLVCNADVIARPNLRELVATHQRLRGSGVKTTLAVMAHPEAGKKYNGLRVERDHVKGFEKSGAPNLFHFPGFYVVDQSCASYFLPDGEEYSVVEKIWEPLAKAGELGAWRYSGEYYDLGTVADIQLAEKSWGKTGR
jgi:NDP-sugar pyrophosphorylase family protein